MIKKQGYGTVGEPPFPFKKFFISGGQSKQYILKYVSPNKAEVTRDVKSLRGPSMFSGEKRMVRVARKKNNLGTTYYAVYERFEKRYKR
jgi:hypothetical protein